METSTYALGQEFNKHYLDVVNSEIIAPPYHTGRVPEAFFLRKRGGIVPDVTLSVDVTDILDEYDYTDSDKYYLVVESGHIHVYHNATRITTGMDVAYTTGINYKFLHIDGAWGTTLESGTAANGSISGTDLIFTDTTKTWTTNQFAGKYLHTISGSTGEGQVMNIASTVAPNILGIDSWTIMPTNSTYKIYPNYGAVLSFVSSDGIYMIHNDTSIDKISAIDFTTVIDAIYSNNQIFFIGTDKGIYVGGKGKANGIFNVNTMSIGFAADAVNIVVYQQFVLILGTSNISTIVSSTLTLSTGVEVTLYKQMPVSNTSAVFGQNTFVIYNNGLYIITRNRRFVALSITATGIDKFFVEEQDQGVYIQRFLDTIITSDSVRVEVSDKNIAIVHRSGSVTTIHTFDFYYKGWYRWITNIPVKRIVRSRMIGPSVYKTDSSKTKDSGDLMFDQYIRIVIGEENIINSKRNLMFKILMGQNTTKDANLVFTAHWGGVLSRVVRTIGNIEYLVMTDALSGENPLFNEQIWNTAILSSSFDSTTVISPINVIEIPTGFFYELCILELEGLDENCVEIGNVFTGYELLQPQMTPVNNVI